MPRTIVSEMARFSAPFDRLWWFLFFDFVERHRDQFCDSESPAALLLRQRVRFTYNGIGWPLEGLQLVEITTRAATTIRWISRGSRECDRWHELLAAFGIELPLPDAVECIGVPADGWIASERRDLTMDERAELVRH